MKIGIYKITSPNGKVYIGQSTNIEKRFRNYKCLDCKQQPKLFNSLSKYRVENHIFEIIKEYKINQLNRSEKYWIKKYNSIKEGLNIKEGGSFGKHNKYTKQKISKANKGKSKPTGFGEKVSKYQKGSIKPKGRIFSEEHKQNLSESLKGKKSNYKKNNLDLQNIKKQYEYLSLNKIAKLNKVSHFTMLAFMKENNIYEFRKNYMK
jgi:group I intron endonuclease